MIKKYKVSFTYTKNIDKSFRYHDTATVLMDNLTDGMFLFNETPITTDPTVYYNLIINHIQSFVNLKKLTPAMEADSFSIIIEELGGLNTNMDWSICPTFINIDDNTEVYNGLLSDLIIHFNPPV